DVDDKTLVNIENKVMNRINVKQKRPDKIKRKMLLLAAAAILLVSTISFQKDTIRAWASEYFSYLPMFNKPFDHKVDSPIYEFDSYIGDHKNFKINNLAFNNDIPYFEIEYEYQTNINVEHYGGLEKFSKYWDTVPVYLKVNSKKYELKLDGKGVDSTGLVTEELMLKDTISKLEFPNKGKVQFVVGEKTFTLQLKEVDKVFLPSKSNEIKNIKLNTMVRKEKNNLLVNYIQTGDFTPFSMKRFEPYLIDSKGNKSLLKSHESGSILRYKYIADLGNLKDKNKLTLITPAISKMISYNQLNWTIPIPKTKGEEIKLPAFQLPNTDIKVEGMIVKWSEFEKATIEIITPNQDLTKDSWYSALYLQHVNPELNKTNSIVSTIENVNNQYKPQTYSINMKNLNTKKLELQITDAIIIENGPWKTDLPEIK
ncbi:hypothetical protein V7056_19865, partial [Bacillus sp. JJ664]